MLCAVRSVFVAHTVRRERDEQRQVMSISQHRALHAMRDALLFDCVVLSCAFVPNLPLASSNGVLRECVSEKGKRIAARTNAPAGHELMPVISANIACCAHDGVRKNHQALRHLYLVGEKKNTREYIVGSSS